MGQKVYDEFRQREYWNSVAEIKDFHAEIDMETFSKYVAINEKILDFGCGYGRTLKELQQYGYKNLIGLDFSDKMIERAKKENLNIEFIVKDTDTIKCDENNFDAVLLIFVLASVYSNEAQNQIISDIRRVLKPGGYIYICDALLNQDVRNQERYEKYQDKYGIYGSFETSDGLIARHLDDNRLKEIIDNFEEKIFRGHTVRTQSGNITNGFTFMGRNNK